MMKRLSTLIFAAGAIAASSDSVLPTYSSTIISSVGCEDGACDSSTVDLAPSSFAWTNGTTVGKLPVEDSSSIADEERSTIYEYETVTTDDIYEVVQTVCDIYSNCYATTELEKFTTYTSTVDGVLTVITTTCPYSEEAEATEGASTTTESDVLTTYEETITVTKTSCDEVCHTSTEVEVLTTSTTTVNGVETIYTTYCPLSSASSSVPVTFDVPETPEPETETELSTTVITITSCADNKCSEIPQTTGVTTITEDNTIYTTYCPLTSESETPEPEPETEEDTTSTITKSKHKTVDVITDNIITETPEPKPTTVAHSSSAITSVTIPEPSSYEGAAAILESGAVGIMISLILALI